MLALESNNMHENYSMKEWAIKLIHLIEAQIRRPRDMDALFLFARKGTLI
jgi:hypothetical protein